VVSGAQGHNGSGALFDAIKGATEPRRSSGPVLPFESSECFVRSSGIYAAIPLEEDLLEVDSQGKRKTSYAPIQSLPLSWMPIKQAFPWCD
jgi:hypothetical protein